MKLLTCCFGLAVIVWALPSTAQTVSPQTSTVPNKAAPKSAHVRTTQDIMRDAIKNLRAGSGPAPSTPEQKAKVDAEHDRVNDLIQDGTQALTAKNFTKAEEDYRQLVQESELGPFAYYGLGEALAGQGKTAEALAAYKTAVYWPLNTPEAQLGLIQRGINIPNLRGCNGETDSLAWLKYALLLSQTGQNGEAFSVYSQAIRWVHDYEGSGITLCPTRPTPSPPRIQAAIHIAMGLLTGGMLGDHEQAMIEFNQARLLSPSSSVTNYYCGYGLKWLGRRAEAQAAFEKSDALIQDGELKAAPGRWLSGR